MFDLSPCITFFINRMDLLYCPKSINDIDSFLLSSNRCLLLSDYLPERFVQLLSYCSNHCLTILALLVSVLITLHNPCMDIHFRTFFLTSISYIYLSYTKKLTSSFNCLRCIFLLSHSY